MHQHIVDYYSHSFSILARAANRKEDNGEIGEATFLYANAEIFWLVLCAYMREQGDFGYLGHKAYYHPPIKARAASRSSRRLSAKRRQART